VTPLLSFINIAQIPRVHIVKFENDFVLPRSKTYQQEICFFHPSLGKPLQPYSATQVFHGELELFDKLSYWSNLAVR